MTTFRNGIISNRNIVRADGFTDAERANEFDISKSNPVDGSDPTGSSFFGSKFKVPQGVRDFMDPKNFRI